MAEKKTHEVVTVAFRGQEFDIDKTAFASLKVQTALNLGDERGEMPDELGCSSDDWQAFTAAVAEAVSAKN